MSEAASTSVASPAYPAHAMPVDLTDATSAAQSLADVHANLQGKVLFYRDEADNLFAIEKKDRPIFFWRQLLSWVLGKAPHYANDEVGATLALLFGDSGSRLQAQMNTGWLFKTKQAIECREFRDAAADAQLKQAEELQERLRSNRRRSHPDAGDGEEEPLPLRKLADKIPQLKDPSAEAPSPRQVAADLTEIQYEYWTTCGLADPKPNAASTKIEVSRQVAAYRERLAREDFKDALLQAGVSYDDVLMIQGAGLATGRNHQIMRNWVGDKKPLIAKWVETAHALARDPDTLWNAIEECKREYLDAVEFEDGWTRVRPKLDPTAKAYLDRLLEPIERRLESLTDGVESKPPDDDRLRGVWADFNDLMFMLEIDSSREVKDEIFSRYAEPRIEERLRRAELTDAQGRPCSARLAERTDEDRSPFFAVARQMEADVPGDGLSIEKRAEKLQDDMITLIDGEIAATRKGENPDSAKNNEKRRLLDNLQWKFRTGLIDEEECGRYLYKLMKRPVHFYWISRCNPRSIDKHGGVHVRHYRSKADAGHSGKVSGLAEVDSERPNKAPGAAPICLATNGRWTRAVELIPKETSQ